MESSSDPRIISSTIDEIMQTDDLFASAFSSSSFHTIDPWHSLSALDTDHVILIEFCESVGPRPVWCIPRVADPIRAKPSAQQSACSVSSSSSFDPSHFEISAFDGNSCETMTDSNCQWTSIQGRQMEVVTDQNKQSDQVRETPTHIDQDGRTETSFHGSYTTNFTSARSSPHFDRNEFAVWLMTADYQATNQRTLKSNFGSGFKDNDVAVMLSNEEQGLHALAYHYTLFDLEARGFLRPLCLSYVTNNARKLTSLFATIRREFHSILKQVKLCNKVKFKQNLIEAIDALEAIQSKTISSYYELYYHLESNSNSENENQQRKQKEKEAQNLLHELMDVDKSFNPLDPTKLTLNTEPDKINGTSEDNASEPTLADKQFDSKRWRLLRELSRVKLLIDQNPRPPILGVDDDDAIDCSAQCQIFDHQRINMAKFVAQLHSKASSGLRLNDPANVAADDADNNLVEVSAKDIRYLSPCVYDVFLADLVDLWRRYQTWNEFCHEISAFGNNDFLAAKLYLGYTPMLFLPLSSKTPNHSFSSSVCSSSADEAVAHFSDSDEPVDNTLLKLGPNVKYVLYPILCGQFFLVHGSEYRRARIERFVRKLSKFIPHVVRITRSQLRLPCSTLNRGSVDPALLADYKLYGLESNSDPFSDAVWQSENIWHFVASLDLDINSLKAVDYGRSGGMLNSLSDRNVLKHHACDDTFVQFVLCILKRFASIAYVLYYHVYADEAVNTVLLGERNRVTIQTTDSVIKMHRFADRFKLTQSDMNIVKYFVELLKNARVFDDRLKSCSSADKNTSINVSLEDKLTSLILKPGPNVTIKLKL